MHKINDLNGLSGCIVELYKDSSSYVVKKTSANLEYNDRLISQILKQKEFNSIQFLKPEILSENVNEDGRYYVFMEYISGINFYDYVDASSIAQSKKILKLLVGNIMNDFGDESVIDTTPIIEKIESLQEKINGYNDIFSYLLSNVPTKLPLKNTHGDLTFENIIISDDQNIYLIDFLDSFVETPYIDLAKLNQEFELKWSIRNKEVTNNLIIKYNYLKTIYNELIQTTKIDSNILNFFTILNLLRILPYAKGNDREVVVTELNIWKTKLQ